MRSFVCECPGPGPSGLLQFDQRTGKIFRMKEQHRFVVRANLWFSVAQDARPRGGEAVARGDDVVDS